jgi:MraZ protein
MLLGNSPAKIDDKGRIKIPTAFRAPIERQFGREFFVTSTNGRFVRLYPLPVWLSILEKLSRVSSFNPAASRFLDAVNYFGAHASMDRQGRLLIQPLLRERAQMNGEVAILGNQDHLDVWNREQFERKLEHEPVSEDDLREIAAMV